MFIGSKSQPYIILLLAFILRLILAPLGTLDLDFNTFFAWSNILVSGGFANFYSGWSDYLPGYMYVLYVLGLIKDSLGISGVGLHFLYKLPAILGDLGTGYLIYRLLEKKSERLALISGAFYVLNPAIFANSTLWGQVDGLIPFFILLSLYLIKAPSLSGVSLAIGTLIKPQAAFAFPLFALLFLKDKKWKDFLLFVLFGGVLFFAAFIPFIGERDPWQFFVERFSISASQYPYSSVNAFNFWSVVVGMWENDNVLYDIGLLFTSVVILFSFIPIFRKTVEVKNVYILLTLLFLLTFNFLTRIHERHLLPVLAPLVLAAAYFPRLWFIYGLLSLTYITNLYYSYIWISEDFKQIIPIEVQFLLALFNVLAAFYVLAVLYKNSLGEGSVGVGSVSKLLLTKVKDTSEVKFFLQNKLKILYVIIGFFALTRFLGIWSPAEFYFDEVYHAFTAREIVRGNVDAWDVWATPPEGYAYEWTHPPFAKLAMAAGMLVFGQNPVGWRLPGVLFGIAALVFVYLLSREIFKKETPALLTVAIFALDGMSTVVSRIGMNDIYFVAFALGTIYFFLKNRHFLSALFFGLALSSKWTAVFVLPILAVAWLMYKRNLSEKYMWFLVLPGLVYIASYTIFFTSGYSLTDWWQTQQQMWWYHTGLEATHPFSSPWWSWPIQQTPVWVYVKELGEKVSNIYVSGNPLVFFAGLFAIVTSLVTIVKERDKGLLFVLICYLAFFLPWSISPRIMFLYHYFPSVPFMIMILSYFLYRIWLAKGKLIVIGYLLLVIGSYFVYYPLWTGIPTPLWWKELLI